MNKDIFYEKVKNNIEFGVIKEIYSSNYVTIFNLGDICYLACPYVLNNNNDPFGIIVSPNELNSFVEDNSLIYELTKQLINKGLISNRAIAIGDNNLEWIQGFIKRESEKGISPYIDHEIENEINNTNKLGR